MNILILSTEIPYPDNSGGRKYTAQRIEMLKKFGHDISIISFKDNNIIDNEKVNEVFKDVILYEKGILKKDIFKLIYTPYTVMNKYKKNIKNKIEKMVINKDIDLIICECPQLLKNISNIKGVPIILIQHNIEHMLYKTIAKDTKNIFKKLIYYNEAYKLKKYEENIVKNNNIEKMVFISEDDMKNYNIDNNQIPKAHIPFTTIAKLEVEKSNNTLDYKRIVFVGKMDYKPNVDAIIWFINNVFQKLQEKFNECKLYIVGKNPTTEIVNISNNNIIVTGMVDSIDDYIKSSDLFIIPLQSGGGVKIKLFDGISNKIPVVTTKFGIEGTGFKDKVHLYEANTAHEFYIACEKVLNGEYTSEMLENSYKLLLENYNFDTVSIKYNQFICGGIE